MKFLVILICLLLNYLWLKEVDRFNDGWFFRFHQSIRSRTDALKGGQSWLVELALVYGVLLAVLALILFFAEGRAFGLPTMLLHILVVLVAFDRTQPGALAKEFLAHWDEGDDEACLLYLQEELDCEDVSAVADNQSLVETFSRLLIYRSFEKMFVNFFWYMLTGPLGILCVYISYQILDSRCRGGAEERDRLVRNFVRLLEWLPVRLLAITFSLVGNFVRSFEPLKASFLEIGTGKDNSEKLYDFARLALSGLVDNRVLEEAGPLEADDLQRKRSALEIGAILGLLERSQAVWLTVLAAVTLIDVGSF